MAKINRTYTVEEAARLFGVHRNTVREWIKRGLPTCDTKRPTLILGRELSMFLLERRRRNRQRCSPGELFCVRCRKPRVPAGEMADYIPQAGALGNLLGICPCCDAWMYRRVNLLRLAEVRGVVTIRVPESLRHIVES